MIKVGIVGYNFMGKIHAQCYRATERAEIIAVADIRESSREEASKELGCKVYHNIDDMLNSSDVDAVDICTPTYLHKQQSIAAANHGKHVLCEKPMALDVESCDAMIEAATVNNVTLMIGHVIRFWPEYITIRNVIESGKYGAINWISARRAGSAPDWGWQSWHSDPAKSGGAILDLHIHDLDYIASLIGYPVSIYSHGIRSSKGGIETAFTLMDHGSGLKSYAECSFAMASGYPFTVSLLVNCESATISYSNNSEPALMVYPHDQPPYSPEVVVDSPKGNVETEGNIAALDGYYNEISYFLDCIETGVKPDIVTLESARKAVQMCEKARHSIESGCSVYL